MRNERAWPQQCWKSCANGSNIVALRFGDHGTKEMLGVVGWKVWPVSNFAQQHTTTSNNMQHGVQTDATCNIQQCWELLPNNVASVCMGLYYCRYYAYKNFTKQHVCGSTPSYPDNFLIILTKSCLSLNNTLEKCEIVNFSWLLFSTLIGQNLLIQKIPYIKMEFKYILFHKLPFIPIYVRKEYILPQNKRNCFLFLFGIVSRGDWI